MKLSRRQMLVTVGAAAIPANGLARSARPRVLVDRALPDIAPHFPEDAVVIDRVGDPVRQLQRMLERSSRPIAGLTNGSDMLVARGSAREARRKFTLIARNGVVFHWTIGEEKAS